MTWCLAIDVRWRTKALESCLQAVERIPSEGHGRPAQFIPYRFEFANKLAKEHKLLLAFDALLLSEALGRQVNLGKIVHGDSHAMLKVKIPTFASEVRKRIKQITALLAGNSPPDLVLNRHCGQCEFKTRCSMQARQNDELSLLSGISEKDRKRLHSTALTLSAHYARARGAPPSPLLFCELRLGATAAAVAAERRAATSRRRRRPSAARYGVVDKPIAEFRSSDMVCACPCSRCGSERSAELGRVDLIRSLRARAGRAAIAASFLRIAVGGDRCRSRRRCRPHPPRRASAAKYGVVDKPIAESAALTWCALALARAAALKDQRNWAALTLSAHYARARGAPPS